MSDESVKETKPLVIRIGNLIIGIFYLAVLCATFIRPLHGDYPIWIGLLGVWLIVIGAFVMKDVRRFGRHLFFLFGINIGLLVLFFIIGQAIVSGASNTIIGDLNARWAAAGLTAPLIIIGLQEALLGTILLIISRFMKPKVIPKNEV